MVEMIWNWHPGIGLGPFKFNEYIERYVDTYKLKKDLEELDNTEWITYEVPNTEISLDVEGERLVSISSYDYFCFKNKNLIGMKLSVFLDLMPSSEYEVGERTEYDDGEVQTAYEFDDVGLQLWESDGVIVGAACREI